MKRVALIIIRHAKPDWSKLSEEEQAGFAARVGRVARKVGVKPVIGYTLTTPGSFLEVWEADDKATLEQFKQQLDALGYKRFYDEVLMLGEREPNWINKEG